MATTSTQSAKRTIVVAMATTAVLVWAHDASATPPKHPPAQELLAAVVVAVMLALLAEVAAPLAAALATVILISAFLDNGAGFATAIAKITQKGTA